MRLRVYSDGGSRSNPGSAAIAFIAISDTGRVLKRHSECIGVRTNNQAEYEALISALESASTLTYDEVICHLDSKLVVEQLNGRYKVKDSELRILWSKVQKLMEKFERVIFRHVPRTNSLIAAVDQMVNDALD